MGEAGLPPETVAQVVAHALTARRPKDRYLIGQDAHLFFLGDKLLPWGLQDWLTLRAIGLDS